MISLNRPYLPDQKKVTAYLDRIYSTAHLTNNGPLLRELQERLEDYLGVENLLLVSSGTAALQVAYQALNLTGNTITTPYTFVATASSQKWMGLSPLFSDIDEKTFNLCPDSAHRMMTESVSALVPTHLYGNACYVEDFESLAERHQVKVVYDAAHAFGVKYKGKSLLSWGDASVLSLHATKLFHTVEGGAVVFKSSDTYEQAKDIINFGISVSDGSIGHVGINAKMSEIHAATGLAMLDDINHVIERRVAIYEQYKDALSGCVEFQEMHENATLNGAYAPLLFDSGETRARVQAHLMKNNVGVRHYFSPSLNQLACLCDGHEYDLPVAENISDRVLCIPLYYDLQQKEVLQVIDQVRRAV